jgi:hypothetical protein
LPVVGAITADEEALFAAEIKSSRIGRVNDQGSDVALDEHAGGGSTEGLAAIEAAEDALTDGAHVKSVRRHDGASRANGLDASGRRLTLAGQVVEAGTAGRQFGLLDKKRGKAVANGKRQAAALAHQVAIFFGKRCVAGVQRAAEQGEKILAEHHNPRRFEEGNRKARKERPRRCCSGGVGLSKREKTSREVAGVRTCLGLRS